MELRLANIDDLYELLRWRNDEITRHSRPDPRFITMDEHREWFARRMAPNGGPVYICEVGGNRVGNITMHVSDRGYEVGWIIAPEWRKNGLGIAMVKKAIAMVPAEQTIWCKVQDDNIASLRLAIAAGFKPVSYERPMLFFELPGRA